MEVQGKGSLGQRHVNGLMGVHTKCKIFVLYVNTHQGTPTVKN